MKIVAVAAVNNEGVLHENLMASPLIKKEIISLKVMLNQRTAGTAYNAGICQTEEDIIVFAHQDVYLPAGWLQKLKVGIRLVENEDPDWAVIGVIGMQYDGNLAGRVWSSGLNREIGNSPTRPVGVVSIDEMLIVLRRSSGIRFDEELPGFHLYGTDIVQTALASGLGAYVIDAPAVHNSTRIHSLDNMYFQCYWYLRRKWFKRLPIATTVLPITRFAYPLWRYKLRSLLNGNVFRKRETIRPLSAIGVAKRLKYE